MLEYALKPVFSALGGSKVVTGVYTLDKQIERREASTFKLDNEIVQRLDRALQSFTTYLT